MHMQPLRQQRRDALGVLSIRTQAAHESSPKPNAQSSKRPGSCMETKRARLIACENNILIQGPS